MKWLSKFIPDCLQIQPDCLPVIAGWAESAAVGYEKKRAAWPENGLALVKGVLQVFNFDSAGVDALSLRASKAQLVLAQQR